MRANPGRAELLDLLHHWRSERYVHRVATNVDRHLFSSCFTRVEIEGLEDAKRRAEAGERLVFVANHQSEYDWMMVQAYLTLHGIRAAVQAGDNLFIGPLDTFLRKCGGFMAVRDQHAFYARRWFRNWMLKTLGTRPVVVTREQYNGLYLDQLKRVFDSDGLHLMVFPGYETDEFSGEVKYGRSYSGRLNPLSPLVFLAVRNALRDLHVEQASYIPINISYERVPEDMVFRAYRAGSRKGKLAKYVYDNYYAFIEVPLKRRVRNQRSRVVIKFGDAMTADLRARAKEVARSVYDQLARLIRVYESTAVFASLDNRFRISRTELEDRVDRTVTAADDAGLDTSPLYRDGRRKSLEELLERTAELFNYPHIPIIATKSYRTLEYDDREVFIHHPHLASYYGNKLSHLNAA